jgi:hypothetical protein
MKKRTVQAVWKARIDNIKETSPPRRDGIEFFRRNSIIALE